MTAQPVTALVPLVPMPFGLQAEAGKAGGGFARPEAGGHRILYVGYESERDRSLYDATGREETPLRVAGRLVDLYV